MAVYLDRIYKTCPVPPFKFYYKMLKLSTTIVIVTVLLVSTVHAGNGISLDTVSSLTFHAGRRTVSGGRTSPVDQVSVYLRVRWSSRRHSHSPCTSYLVLVDLVDVHTFQILSNA